VFFSTFAIKIYAIDDDDDDDDRKMSQKFNLKPARAGPRLTCCVFPAANFVMRRPLLTICLAKPR
jgi:hypothetical protein